MGWLVDAYGWGSAFAILNLIAFAVVVASVSLWRFEPLEGEALESLRLLVQESRIDLPGGLPPMASCLIGYMGYDMVRLMERLPSDNPDVLGLPDAVFFRPTLVAVFDRVEDLVTIVTPVWPSQDVSAEAAYQQASERLADAVADFERSLPYRREPVENRGDLPEPQSNMTREQFHEMVAIGQKACESVDKLQRQALGI